MKNNQKIVFIDLDEIGNPILGAGQAKATFEVGKRLVRAGYSVEVICSRFPGSRDKFYEGIFYRHIGLGTKNIKINNAAFIMSLPFVVPFLKADFIIECFTAPISTCFTPLFTKIPVIGLPTSFEAERFAKLYHLPFDKIQKIGLKTYKYFAPYTNHLDIKMKKQNPSVFSKIIPEGVGDEFFKIKPRKPKFILFLGRFDIGQKGIDLFLQAYAMAKDKIPFPVVIAGHGPDRERIIELVHKLHLEKYVRVEGSTFGKRKEKMLSDALFIAFPSRHEGFSLFSLESLASGLPMVAFDIPALSWAPETAVLKAKQFDIKDYSQKLAEAADLKRNRIMRLSARRVAKKYRWDNVCDSFISFFEDISKLEDNRKNLRADVGAGRFA